MGEIAAAAGLLGRSVAVTVPLSDAALAGIFGTAAAPELIALGVLAHPLEERQLYIVKCVCKVAASKR